MRLISLIRVVNKGGYVQYHLSSRVVYEIVPQFWWLGISLCKR